MASLAELGNRVVAESKLGPVARLMPTTAATTLRYGGDALVVDGPFAETAVASSKPMRTYCGHKIEWLQSLGLTD